MSNAKRRRRGKHPAQARRAAATAPRPAQPPAERPAPRWLGWLARPTADSAFPSIPAALRSAAIAVGSSAPILLTTFGFVFLAWIGLVALGLEGPPGRLVNLPALPPIGTYFDALNGVTIFGYGTPGIVAAGAFLLVRAGFVAVLTGMAVAAFEGTDARTGAIRGLRAYPPVLAVNILSLSMMVAGTIVLPFLGPGFGFLGSVLILVAALFAFAFVPAAAVTEGRSLSETLRRGWRAATMPGSRHVLMSMLYIFLSLPLLVAFTPGGSRLTVNPGLATWVYALVASFVHVVFLAAFVFRWMAVREIVPEEPVRARRR